MHSSLQFLTILKFGFLEEGLDVPPGKAGTGKAILFYVVAIKNVVLLLCGCHKEGDYVAVLLPSGR